MCLPRRAPPPGRGLQDATFARARRRSSDGDLRGVEPDGLPTAGSGSPDERVKGSGCPRRAPRCGRRRAVFVVMFTEIEKIVI